MFSQINITIGLIMKRINKFTVKIMLTILIVLLHHSWTKADQISEFEIEGISIGNSALDHFSRSQIQNNTYSYPASDKYKRVQNDKLPFFKTYDAVDFRFKTKSKNFIIESLSGIILYKRNFDRCYDKQKEIVNELTSILNDYERGDSDHVYNDDHWKGSRSVQVSFILKNGDIISVHCNDYSEDHGGQDHLSVNLKKKEFDDFLASAYN